jgi:hypothetical protein
MHLQIGGNVRLIGGGGCDAYRVFTRTIAAHALLAAQDALSAVFGAGFDRRTGKGRTLVPIAQRCPRA